MYSSCIPLGKSVYAEYALSGPALSTVLWLYENTLCVALSAAVYSVSTLHSIQLQCCTWNKWALSKTWQAIPTSPSLQLSYSWLNINHKDVNGHLLCILRVTSDKGRNGLNVEKCTVTCERLFFLDYSANIHSTNRYMAPKLIPGDFAIISHFSLAGNRSILIISSVLNKMRSNYITRSLTLVAKKFKGKKHKSFLYIWLEVRQWKTASRKSCGLFLLMLTLWYLEHLYFVQ